MSQLPPRGPNYQVDGLPPALKAKITEFGNACLELAWIGAHHPDNHRAIRENMHRSRYDLERAIKTHLERNAK